MKHWLKEPLLYYECKWTCRGLKCASRDYFMCAIKCLWGNSSFQDLKVGCQVVAVTRYVFNKPNPEDKLNVDIVKRIIWIWQLTQKSPKKGCWLAANSIFSDVGDSCIFMHQKWRVFRTVPACSWSLSLKAGLMKLAGWPGNMNIMDWSRNNCLDFYTQQHCLEKRSPLIHMTGVAALAQWGQRHRGLRQKNAQGHQAEKVQPASTFAAMQIGLFCNVTTVFLLLVCDLVGHGSTT